MLEEKVNKVIMQLKDVLCDEELTNEQYMGLEEHLVKANGLYSPDAQTVEEAKKYWDAVTLLNEKIRADPDIEAAMGLKDDYMFLSLKGPSDEAKQDIRKFIELKFNMMKHLAYKRREDGLWLNYDNTQDAIYKRMEFKGFFGVTPKRAFDLSHILSDQFMEYGIDSREYDTDFGIHFVPGSSFIPTPRKELVKYENKRGNA